MYLLRNVKKRGLISMILLVIALWSYSQPCFTGYTYRLPVVINNSTGAEEKDLQLSFTINTAALITASKMQSNGADIRFLDRFGNQLSHWVEDGSINTNTTKIWVKTDSILGYNNDTIYMYYGNSTASSANSINSTFSIFDDFTGTSLGVGWSQCGGGSVSVGSGALTLSSSTGDRKVLTTVGSFSAPLIIEVKVNSSSTGFNFIGSTNTSGTGYAMAHNSTMGLYKISPNATTCFTSSSINSASTGGTINGIWTYFWNNGNIQGGTWPGGTTSGSDNTTAATTEQKIVLGNSNGGSIEIDWVRARKYSPNTITLSFGTEVSMNYTITPSYDQPLCEGQDLKLRVNQIPGATYLWTGPAGSGFSSTQREPVINGSKLSDAGQYTISVRIPTGCAVQSATVNVSITEKSKGGTLNGSTTVCGGSNSGTLTLANQVGNILGWDTAQSISGPWRNITTNSNSRLFSDLTTSTFYRVIVKNGTCANDTSTIATVAVTPASEGGTISGADSVCQGNNSGILSVSGNVGNIERWESSVNGFLWTSINNRSTTQNYTNLNQTTFYRAVAKNGLCNEALSDVKTIYVDLSSNGGNVSGATNACAGNNQGRLNLTGQRGQVVAWESSQTGNSPWSSITNNTDSLIYNNINNTTFYRALVRNGRCNIAVSNPAMVTIIPKSVGGAITGSATVCESANSGTLTLNGQTGSVVRWETRTIGANNWNIISNIGTTLSWGSLSDSTEYRAIVSNQGCAEISSDTATINVDKLTQSGFLSGNNQACEGTNNGTITLNSFIGNILGWQTSNTGFAPWTNVNNTTDQLNFSNLNNTIFYRSLIKNGVCAQSNTQAFRVQVDKQTNGGFSGSDVAVCAGSNLGLIGLNNYVGEILKWETTNDTTTNIWNPIVNFTNRQDFRDLNATTFYRATIKNGSCTEANSTITTISVDLPTDAGIILGDTVYCGDINSGKLNITSYQGQILRWETSHTGNAPWNQIINTTDEFNYNNLDKTTFYRAIIQSGVCSRLTTPVSLIKINSNTTAGILSSEDTSLCTGVNFGSLFLDGNNGNINYWEKSDDNMNWIRINNTGKQHFFYNQNQSVHFRVIVQNDICPSDTSNQVFVKVFDKPVGGQLTQMVEMCQNTGQETIYLTNYVGDITRWESAPTIQGPWTIENHTADSLIISAPGSSRFYRTIIESGACGIASSNESFIKVYEPSIAGTLFGGGEICDSVNAGQVLISSNLGDVIDWETAPFIGGPWTSTGQTNNTFSYFNLTNNIAIRAKVRNGVCADLFTTPVEYTIVPRPQPDFTLSQSCVGTPTTFFDASTISNGTINDYLWSMSDGFTNAQTTFQKTFLNKGIYTVILQVRSDKGCINSITRQVSVDDSPMANYRFEGDLGNGIICDNDTLFFKDLSTFPSDVLSVLYDWDFGDGTFSNLENPGKKYDNPGVYNAQLKVTTNNGCSDSLRRFVTVYKTVRPNAGPDRTISKGISHTLNGSGGLLYNWSPSEFLNNPLVANPIARINESTTFILETTDNNGCVSRDSVTLSILSDFKVRPNNVITPDGNGENDTWIVHNIDNYPDNTVSVFDRWGREVFSTKNYQNDWGGTGKNSQQLMDGTYYYVIEFDQNDVVYKGAITIINTK